MATILGCTSQIGRVGYEGIWGHVCMSAFSIYCPSFSINKLQGTDMSRLDGTFGPIAVEPPSILRVMMLHSPTALKGVMVPAANGRPLVRSTLASRSLSHRSFTVHPAPRSSSAPAPKSAKSFTSGRAPAGAARAIDQKHGQARSHVPATCLVSCAVCADGRKDNLSPWQENAERRHL